MTLEIQSVTVTGPKTDQYSVDLLISDTEDVSDASEYVSISVLVPRKNVDGISIEGLEMHALKRAREIIEEKSTALYAVLQGR